MMHSSRIRWLGVRHASPAAVALLLSASVAQAADRREFTQDFRTGDCEFSNLGGNPYFSLQPGRRATYDGEEDGLALRLRITVLDRTRNIEVPDVGVVSTRIVEEKEWLNGTLVERSLNYFAICAPTNDVYYFGEAVDIFEDDGTVSHEGAWLAGRKGARPGIVMPGAFLLGARYYQELAPGVALDRAEHVRSGVSVETGEGTLGGCVEIVETSPLEPRASSTKRYCPDIGLVADDEVVLTTIQQPGAD